MNVDKTLTGLAFAGAVLLMGTLYLGLPTMLMLTGVVAVLATLARRLTSTQKKSSGQQRQ